MVNASSMGGVTVIWDDAAISYIPHTRPAQAMIYRAAAEAVVTMKSLIPVSKVQPVYATRGATVRGGVRSAGDFPLRPSGFLRNSVHALPDGEGGILIGATAPYAEYVNNGTPPHEIRSTGSWPLRNRATGQVFGPVVHHPGTRGAHFTERTALSLTGRRFHEA